MTTNDAIFIIQKEIVCVLNDKCIRDECSKCNLVMETKDILSALHMAIDALKKQIPKEPYYQSDGYCPEGREIWDAHCPNCEHELDEDDICPNCGQFILWEG